MTFAPAIGFDYHPPRALDGLALVGLLLALLALAACGWPWPAKVLTSAVVLVLVLYERQRMGRRPVHAAAWLAEGTWTLRLADGSDVPAALASFRVLGPLVLLRLLPEGGRAVVLFLFPGNADADLRRRLRMRLAGWRKLG